ncbi:MAG: hypothetical protein WCI73_08535 [Phycisphaerae bacterium]
MKNNAIHDFILAKERNIVVAAAVSDAWAEARAHVVNKFLNRLGTKLVKHLRGWEHEPWKQFLVEPYSNFSFWKTAWVDQYWIVLQCQPGGQQLLFGVMRNEDRIGRRPFCPEILTAIQKIHPSARSRTWWEAVVTLRSPAPDWSKPEVLWQMHTDAAFLNDVAEQLLAVAKASESIVDRLVKKRH